MIVKKVLDADIVKTKGGEQTDDAVGNQLACLSQVLVSGEIGFGRHVNTWPGSHHQFLPA